MTGSPSPRWRTSAAPQSVAASDLTLSPLEFVSAGWALADAETQAVIYRSHLDAVSTALGWAERHVFASRSGSGGVVREPYSWVVAAASVTGIPGAGDPHTCIRMWWWRTGAVAVGRQVALPGWPAPVRVCGG